PPSADWYPFPALVQDSSGSRNVSATEELIAALADARRRTLTLIGDLEGAQWTGPRLPIVNPPLWEFGHVAWFHEYWERRQLRGLPPLRADGDRLYDSAKVAHDTRWDLPLPSFAEARDYATAVLDHAADWLGGREPSPETRYFHRLGVLHE